VMPHFTEKKKALDGGLFFLEIDESIIARH
jgi:hypothetical protein